MRRNLRGALPGRRTATAAAEVPVVGCNWDLVAVGIRQACINVYGEGLFVDRLSGELEKVGRWPSPILEAQVQAFGTLESGVPWSETGSAPFSVSSISIFFAPRASFRDGSDLCIRTSTGEGEWSDPACVAIRR